MSDKRGMYQNEPPNFLKKKSSRKKKQIQKLEKDFDIKKFKDKIFNELTNENLSIKQEQNDKSTSDFSSDYDKKFKEYVQEGLSYNTLMFVNRIILESTTLPPGLRNNFALHKILFNVVKTLLMNELEIVYLSLYLDKMGWTTEGYQIDENLLITGISVKMYLNSNYTYIIEHLSKKMKIEERFNLWLTIKRDYYNSMTIAPRELNERFKILSKPFNTFCKQNYIDFNFIVDKILKMSLPYSESKQVQDKIGNDSQEPSVYEPTISVIKQPDSFGNSQTHTQKSEHNLMGSQNMKFFSSSMENAYYNPGNFFHKGENNNMKQVQDINNLNNIGNLNNSLANIQNINNHNNSFNLGVGRMDSFNILFRDGSFYNLENDRFLPSRGTSQMFQQFGEEGQDESKHFFSKNNAFRNVSIQSLGNNVENLQYPNHQNISSVNLPYPNKNIIIDNSQNQDKKGNEIKIGDNPPLSVVKEESLDSFNCNRTFSFEKEKKNSIDDPKLTTQKESNNNPKNLKLLFPGSEKTERNINLFKKLKEEKESEINSLKQK